MEYQTFDKSLDKDKTKKETKEILKEIGRLQYKMYAEAKSSLLIVFQGLDASGKDGLTKGLLKYCNPVGISIKSFKKPTPEEYVHDFLWRIHQHTPAKGQFQVFIRSHYEDILGIGNTAKHPHEVARFENGNVHITQRHVPVLSPGAGSCGARTRP